MTKRCTGQQMPARRRVEAVLRGNCLDATPFTIYESQIPQCAAEREMRNRGLCLVERRVPVFTTSTPNVKSHREVYRDGRKKMTRTFHETPYGTLSSLDEAAGFTSWHHEKLFKGQDDYKALLFIIQDEVYEPCYEAAAAAQERAGEDIIFRAAFGLEPLQALISGLLMDMQTFCMEWMDNRDEILKLYTALVENRRKVYPLVAESPFLHANYGGNVTPEIIGVETFRDYYVPHYNEAAEIMHKCGKFVGCHFDANCKLIAEEIAASDLDYVEAFTPAPDTDMSLAEARAAWPDKVLWINFPSSLHLEPDAEVEERTVGLLNELSSTDGLIMAITEAMPEDRWRGSCSAIMDGLARHAEERPDMYGGHSREHGNAPSLQEGEI